MQHVSQALTVTGAAARQGTLQFCTNLEGLTGSTTQFSKVVKHVSDPLAACWQAYPGAQKMRVVSTPVVGLKPWEQNCEYCHVVGGPTTNSAPSQHMLKSAGEHMQQACLHVHQLCMAHRHAALRFVGCCQLLACDQHGHASIMLCLLHAAATTSVMPLPSDSGGAAAGEAPTPCWHCAN